MNATVEYKVSTWPSRFLGYQAKKGDVGEIKIFASKIWNILDKSNLDKNDLDEHGDSLFDRFVEELITTTIVERCCLERAFQKIRMKNRCKPAIFLLEGEKMNFGCRMGFIGFSLHVGLGSDHAWELLQKTTFHEIEQG